MAKAIPLLQEITEELEKVDLNEAQSPEGASVSESIPLGAMSDYAKRLFVIMTDKAVRLHELYNQLEHLRIDANDGIAEFREKLLEYAQVRCKLEALQGLFWATLYAEFKDKIPRDRAIGGIALGPNWQVGYTTKPKPQPTTTKIIKICRITCD